MKNPQIINPKDTPEERLAQYMTALIESEGDTFTNRNLGCAGRKWDMCTDILQNAGLIEATRFYTPYRYRLLVSRECLKGWADDS